MPRSAVLRAAPPADPDERRRKNDERRRPIEGRRRTIQETADYFTTHRSMVEKWVADGCPHVDIAPGDSKKRCLRFDVLEVDRWLRRRS